MTTTVASSTGQSFNSGDWLFRESEPAGIFSPERLSDEHRLIVKTVADFVEGEVLPSLDRLEHKDWARARALVTRCGDLGLLGVDVAESDGGLELDKITSMLVSEQMAQSASFGATFGAHANLTILPLSLFGTSEQKKRYLPGLMTGELVGAYCLSEPGSGSDALGARTRADRQDDGSFLLNGEKSWITNGGFADVFIVFGKVMENDRGHFTAFLVERAFQGVSSGQEEHKMGLHGSSTTPVILENVRVPAGNLLGDVGKGHTIAFNVLNFGRFKLGAMCVGGARRAIGEAARYAGQRKQFGRPIASFGAIKHKLGEMVVRTYGVESLIYRTAGLIQSRIDATARDHANPSAALSTLEEYAVEASIAKVAGSETLDFVLDENIQIHGGNGYVTDYPAERYYRDSRVNRIFEGTNEINRLLIPGTLAHRASQDSSGLLAAAWAARSQLPAARAHDVSIPAGALAPERQTVDRLKKVVLIVFGLALETYHKKLSDEQEVLMHLADMMIDVYASDSAVLRASVASSNESLQIDTVRVLVNDAAIRLRTSAWQALAIMVGGKTLNDMVPALEQELSLAPLNTAILRRRIADATVERGGYLFA
jgi:alkylation response protein AidB-like acyl-CoA dehydrogenase